MPEGLVVGRIDVAGHIETLGIHLDDVDEGRTGAGAARLGDVVRLRAAIPGLKWFAFYSPAAVERVLHGNQRNYVKPPIIVRSWPSPNPDCGKVP